jgi:hypothetical protein
VNFVSTNFTADEIATLIDLLVGTIEHHPFPQSLQVQRLRSILEKVRPMPKLQLEEAIERNGFEDHAHD